VKPHISHGRSEGCRFGRNSTSRRPRRYYASVVQSKIFDEVGQVKSVYMMAVT
jgi:hypothetical protein